MSPTPDKDRQRILSLLAAERFEEALQIESGGRLADLNRAFVRLSARWSQDDDVKAALNKARSVLMSESERARGTRFFKLRKFDQAEVWLRKAVAKTGQQLDYHWLGRTLADLGRNQEAIDQFRKAVTLAEDATDLLWLGSLLIDQGHAEESLPWLTKAVKIRGDASDQFWLGRALTLCGRAPEGLTYLRAVVGRRGTPDDHYWLGRALADSGAKPEAAREFERVVKERGLAEHRHWLGRTLAEIGRNEEAVPHLRRAVTLRGLADDYHWLGVALSQSGRAAEAVAHLTAAVEKRGDPADHHWLGVALCELDRHAEAIIHLDEAVDSRGDGADYYYAGIALDKLGNRQAAATYFRKAVEKRGDDADYQRLGVALFDTKQTSEALAMFRRVLEREETGVNYHWVGRALLDTGAPEEALPYLLQAFRMRSKAIDLLLLKRALRANFGEAIRLMRAGWLKKAERRLSMAHEATSGLKQLEDEARHAVACRIDILVRVRQSAGRRNLSLVHFAEPLALIAQALDAGAANCRACILLNRAQIERAVGDYAAARNTAEEARALADDAEAHPVYSPADFALEAARAARLAGSPARASELLALIDHPGLSKPRRLPILIERAAIQRTAKPPDPLAAVEAAREARRSCDEECGIRDRLQAHVELGLSAAMAGIAGESSAAFVIACRLAIDTETDERQLLLAEVLKALESGALTGTAQLWAPRIKLAQSGW